MSRQEIENQYRKNTVTDQFMLRHNKKIEGRIYVTTESFNIATLIIATWKSLLREIK